MRAARASDNLVHHVTPVMAALVAMLVRTEGVGMRNDDDEVEESGIDAEVVDEIGAAVGLTYAADEQLRAGDKEAERDAHRWELDPASADDYAARTHARTSGPSGEILHMTHRGHTPHGGSQ